MWVYGLKEPRCSAILLSLHSLASAVPYLSTHINIQQQYCTAQSWSGQYYMKPACLSFARLCRIRFKSWRKDKSGARKMATTFQCSPRQPWGDLTCLYVVRQHVSFLLFYNCSHNFCWLEIDPPPSLQALPFHVQFCTYNAVQLLIDLGVVETESLPIENEEQTLDELIARLEQTLNLLDLVSPNGFAGKESNMIDVSLGPFSVNREAMKYVHEISVPSLWGSFHFLCQRVMKCSFLASSNIKKIRWLTFCYNSWFHHTMVYGILRAQGVPLTKQLFLSAW